LSVTIARGTYCTPFRSRLKKRFAGMGVAPGLNQDIEHDAILINGAP
jgi:hypothetical protein